MGHSLALLVPEPNPDSYQVSATPSEEFLTDAANREARAAVMHRHARKTG